MRSKNVVVRGFGRPHADQLQELARYGVATLHEAQNRTGLLAPYIRPIYPGASATGSAVTVYVHPGDNTMLHVAAAECQAGDILVIACSSDSSDGMLGELLGTSFRARGAVGVVIDAGCRDVAELTKMQFPVWSKAISAKGTAKGNVGSVNIPVVCAGATVYPGDAVRADDDGVVVVRRAELDEVLQAAKARDEKESRVRARLAAGELGLDIYGMRDKLSAWGLIFIDAAEGEPR